MVPHAAFAGQTPDEMYFGRGEQVPADLATAHARARDARMKTNRELSCQACKAILGVAACFPRFLCNFQLVASAARKLPNALSCSWAMPEPSANIVLHPDAAQRTILSCTGALPVQRARWRGALCHYLGPITMRPTEENGVKAYVAEGVIDATDALRNTGNPGIWTRTAYVSVVAGPRFELGTFGL